MILKQVERVVDQTGKRCDAISILKISSCHVTGRLWALITHVLKNFRENYVEFNYIPSVAMDYALKVMNGTSILAFTFVTC